MISRLQQLFVTVPNFPIENFIFPDITPILESDPIVFKIIIDHIYEIIKNDKPDYIVCIESFGYAFGVPVAYKMGTKILLARKEGKLPRNTKAIKYDMVYDNNRIIELHDNVLKKGQKIIIIDDFLATGGTAKAVINIIAEMEAMVLKSIFIVELTKLDGRKTLKSFCPSIYSLIDMELNQTTKEWEIIDTRLNNHLF